MVIILGEDVIKNLEQTVADFEEFKNTESYKQLNALSILSEEVKNLLSVGGAFAVYELAKSILAHKKEDNANG